MNNNCFLQRNNILKVACADLIFKLMLMTDNGCSWTMHLQFRAEIIENYRLMNKAT
jgi:hypothetical protein